MVVQIISGTVMLIAMYLIFSGKVGSISGTTGAIGAIGTQLVNAITALQGRPL